MTKHSDLIPNFLEASTPGGLRSLMFRNNARVGGECQYFDFQTYSKNGKQIWICWFYEKVSDLNGLTE